jgi:hypothetical protein
MLCGIDGFPAAFLPLIWRRGEKSGSGEKLEYHVSSSNFSYSRGRTAAFRLIFARVSSDFAPRGFHHVESPRRPQRFFRLIPRLSVLPVLVAGLLLPAAAQVTYTGTTATQNFDSQAIGSPKTVSLSFSVAAGTTVGSIGVLTQGAPNLDFTSAAGTTCTAKTYSSAATCVVEVIFKPKAAGLRMGAVVFFRQLAMQVPNLPAYRSMELEAGRRSRLGQAR